MISPVPLYLLLRGKQGQKKEEKVKRVKTLEEAQRAQCCQATGWIKTIDNILRET